MNRRLLAPVHSIILSAYTTPSPPGNSSCSHRNPAGEHYLLDSGIAGSEAHLRSPLHVGFVIARERADIVAVFGGEIDDGRSAASQFTEGFVLPYIAVRPEIWERFAWPEVANP